MLAPNSYSPTSLAQFTNCPLAFKYAYIDKLPQKPQLAATRGNIVHRALELLFHHEPNKRSKNLAFEMLDRSFIEYSSMPELCELNLNDVEQKQLKHDCESLIKNYFKLENPELIIPIGIEIKLEYKNENTLLRGIIDRLELDDNSNLIVSDYKTGSTPRTSNEDSKFAGVYLYSYLCHQIFGVLPAKVQLIYLKEPTIITATPTFSKLKGIEIKSTAIHKAVSTACEKNDFRANIGPLCHWCSYKEICPAQGKKHD
ncbi:MAG: PD-(D/E)XK nuclease family protein [Acidimicrobiia bacterium]